MRSYPPRTLALCVPALLALLLVRPARAGAEEAVWKAYDKERGATFEKRAVAGSKYEEFRATMDVPQSPAQCMEVFWKVATDLNPTKELKKTRVRESADEILIYEQISLSLVSDRDYTIRIWRLPPAADGTRELRFETANDQGPAVAKGYVRLDVVRGVWRATPLPDGKTRLLFTTHSDPGGSIPAVFARGAQRDRFEVDFWAVADKLPPPEEAKGTPSPAATTKGQDEAPSP